MLAGTVTESGDMLRQGSWLRLPEGQPFAGVAEGGAKLWMKTGHLRIITAPL